MPVRHRMHHMAGKRAGPIDVHVGARIRLRRNLLGLSQNELGRALGVSFQQVQKYENGTNRIGASRLHLIAQALDTTPAWFFERAPRPVAVAGSSVARVAEARVTAFMRDRDAALLIRHWVRLPRRVRSAIVRLVARAAEPHTSDKHQARQYREKP